MIETFTDDGEHLAALLSSREPVIVRTPATSLTAPPFTIPANVQKVWHGYGTEVWINNPGGDAIVFDGAERGQSKGSLIISGPSIRSNGEAVMRLVNANAARLTDVHLKGGQSPLVLATRGANGWAEQNQLRGCSGTEAKRAALSFEAVGKPSFNATRITGWVSHVVAADARTLYVAPEARLYGSVVEGNAWTFGGGAGSWREKADWRLEHNDSVVIEGDLAGTRLRWSTENGARWGIRCTGAGLAEARVDLHCVWPHGVGVLVEHGPAPATVTVTGDVLSRVRIL